MGAPRGRIPETGRGGVGVGVPVLAVTPSKMARCPNFREPIIGRHASTACPARRSPTANASSSATRVTSIPQEELTPTHTRRGSHLPTGPYAARTPGGRTRRARPMAAMQSLTPWRRSGDDGFARAAPDGSRRESTRSAATPPILGCRESIRPASRQLTCRLPCRVSITRSHSLSLSR